MSPPTVARGAWLWPHPRGVYDHCRGIAPFVVYAPPPPPVSCLQVRILGLGLLNLILGNTQFCFRQSESEPPIEIHHPASVFTEDSTHTAIRKEAFMEKPIMPGPVLIN